MWKPTAELADRNPILKFLSHIIHHNGACEGDIILQACKKLAVIHVLNMILSLIFMCLTKENLWKTNFFLSVN